MHIIKDVSDWLCLEFYLISIQNCSSAHSLQTVLLLVPTRKQGVSCQKAISWASHPVPSLLSHPIPSHPISPYPILSTSACIDSAAAEGRGAHLPALPLRRRGLHIWAWGRIIHTQKQAKQQNPTGSTIINCCFPHLHTSQSSFLLT